ncbi:hypothetical protein EI94DRAFT_1810486 [Lactarius quietus]|nr:hypothetical protein EI94DRAFT_1810486 [Lactarius quietus]
MTLSHKLRAHPTTVSQLPAPLPPVLSASSSVPLSQFSPSVLNPSDFQAACAPAPHGNNRTTNEHVVFHAPFSQRTENYIEMLVVDPRAGNSTGVSALMPLLASRDVEMLALGPNHESLAHSQPPLTNASRRSSSSHSHLPPPSVSRIPTPLLLPSPSESSPTPQPYEELGPYSLDIISVTSSSDSTPPPPRRNARKAKKRRK